MADELPEPGPVVLMGVLFEGGLALLAIFLGWLFACPPLEKFDWSWSAAGAGAAATLPPLIFMLWCTRSSLEPCRAITRMVDEAFVPLFRQCTLVDLALVSLAAGVGEELLFRGFLQEILSSGLGPALGLAAASVLFGLAHPITSTYVLFATLFGVYLGGLWLMTDNLLAAVVTHAAYDFVTLAYLVSRRQRGLPCQVNPPT